MNQFHNKSNDPAVEARLNELLQLLYSFYDKEIEMSLERVSRFLERLGNPHLNLPPVVHIAGTNGKGSTISMLKSMLEGSNASVHMMTSPHLIHVTERIVIAGKPISSEALVALLEECLAVNNDEPVTFFEILTAATYLAFSRVDADYCLLETGMGGRLDATNVVPDPVCTIITTISKDHEKFLGDTLEKIAYEKAGIMKAGVPCIIGYQTADAIDSNVPQVFHQQSSDLHPSAKLFQHGAEWQIKPDHGQIRFTFEDEVCHLPKPNLQGFHQIYNLGAALSAYRVITERPIEPKTLSPALQSISWPARLQTLETGTLKSLLPDDWSLMIDGAHNDSAGAFLAQQMQAWQDEGIEAIPVHLVIAMVNRKDPQALLNPLLPYVESITVNHIEGEATSFTPDELYDLVKPLGFKAIYKAETKEGALEVIRDKHPSKRARVLMTGSLYFMGNILSDLGEA